MKSAPKLAELNLKIAAQCSEVHHFHRYIRHEIRICHQSGNNTNWEQFV